MLRLADVLHPVAQRHIPSPGALLHPRSAGQPGLWYFQVPVVSPVQDGRAQVGQQPVVVGVRGPGDQGSVSGLPRIAKGVLVPAQPGVPLGVEQDREPCPVWPGPPPDAQHAKSRPYPRLRADLILEYALQPPVQFLRLALQRPVQRPGQPPPLDRLLQPHDILTTAQVVCEGFVRERPGFGGVAAGSLILVPQSLRQVFSLGRHAAALAADPPAHAHHPQRRAVPGQLDLIPSNVGQPAAQVHLPPAGQLHLLGLWRFEVQFEVPVVSPVQDGRVQVVQPLGVLLRLHGLVDQGLVGGPPGALQGGVIPGQHGRSLVLEQAREPRPEETRGRAGTVPVPGQADQGHRAVALAEDPDSPAGVHDGQVQGEALRGQLGSQVCAGIRPLQGLAQEPLQLRAQDARVPDRAERLRRRVEQGSHQAVLAKADGDHLQPTRRYHPILNPIRLREARESEPRWLRRPGGGPPRAAASRRSRSSRAALRAASSARAP